MDQIFYFRRSLLPGMYSIILAYLFILVVYALEIFVPQSRQARSLARGSFDRRSTIMILLSFALVIAITPYSFSLCSELFPTLPGWPGLLSL